MRTCLTESGSFVSIPDSTGDDFAQGFYQVRGYSRNTRVLKGGGRVNTMMRAILVGLLLLTVGVAASTPSRRTMPAPAVLTGSAAPGAFFDYVLVIVMENHNICDLLASCGGTATYLSDLAGSYGVATKEMYCHVNPSLPNYLCLTSGSDFGCTADPGPNSTTCTKTAWGATNIVDRLEADGLTWKGYMEDMPGSCYATDSGNYVVHHNPFMYYSDIASDATRCARVVPAGTPRTWPSSSWDNAPAATRLRRPPRSRSGSSSASRSRWRPWRSSRSCCSADGKGRRGPRRNRVHRSPVRPNRRHAATKARTRTNGSSDAFSGAPWPRVPVTCGASLPRLRSNSSLRSRQE